ncbi:MAG: NUDIX hydrolase [Candidatus Eremiobacteraeota bacterium]|nr:NUDIX hydrolase [Candidatus Eremiobacteraeota bacterium]
MDSKPQVISSTPRFSGRVFRVRTDEVRYSDGATHAVDVVEHGASAAIIAATKENEIVLVRQYRHAIGRELWEVPAGRAEAGEDVAQSAARELTEETGYIAASLRPLGGVAMTPGFCDEIIYFFYATELSAGEQSLDDDERITVESYSLERAQRLVETGQIADAKTIIALQWFAGNRAELVGTRADN